MAQVDTSIYNNLQPTVKLQTPFELQGQFQQIQQGQNQNRLAQMEFQKAERAEAERNALAGIYEGAYSNGKIDHNKVIEGLATNRLGANIPAYLKQQNEAEASGVELSNKRLDGKKKQFEITQMQRERSAAELGSLINDPELSHDKVFASIERSFTSGDIDEQQARQMIDLVRQKDPAQLKPFLNQILMSVMKPKEQIESGDRNRNNLILSDGSVNQALVGAKSQIAQAGATQNYGSPVAGVGPDGKPVFFQPNKGGGAPSVVQGVTPPISAAERKAEAELKAADARKKGIITQVSNVLKEIDDAERLVGYSTAGVGGLMKGVPMTDARNLDAKLQTIKANLGFDRLQQMREESPTGGALGQVAVQELTALQATVASLDQLQHPEQLKEALAKIKKHYKAWGDVMKKANGDNTPPTGNLKAASSYLSGAKDKADFIARARALKAKGWTEEQIAAANGE